MKTTVQEVEALDAYSQAISTAVERVAPTMVQVETGQRSQRGMHSHGKGIGSGVIYSHEGHIITNAHVVQGASRVVVTLADGRAFPAGVVGIEPAQDLAVLRVAQTHLPVAEFRAAPLRVGQLVIAIGHPYGLSATVTAGVISALNRSLTVSAQYKLEHLIQTDTSINPGNSGGPLVDAQGRVVGITTAILPFAQGVGFAIPTSTTYDVIGHVTEAHRQRMRQGVLGISGLDINLDDSSITRQDTLKQNRGVLLLEVAHGGAAHYASLRSGDVLLALEEQPVTGVDELRTALQKLKGRTPWRVTFLREGRQRHVSLLPQG